MVEPTREGIEQQLSEARRARGVAALDGRRFDHSAIAALEASLDAIGDADAERARRARELQAERQRAETTQLANKLTKLEAERLQAWADAEAACRALRDAATRINQTTQSAAVVAGKLWSRSEIGTVFNKFESDRRAGGRISSVLSTIPGCLARLGGLTWAAHGIFPPGSDWHDAERKLAASLMTQLERLTNVES